MDVQPRTGYPAVVTQLGLGKRRFDWIATQDMAIYCIVICVLWHSSGLVMAILLAGLRGVDEELWKAARIEGIPRWRYYVSIVLPQLGPAFGTATVLLAVSVVKLYDAVVAMTNGGPGDATDVPTKFIMDNLLSARTSGWPRPRRRPCWSPWSSSLRRCFMRARASTRRRAGHERARPSRSAYSAARSAEVAMHNTLSPRPRQPLFTPARLALIFF